VEDHAAVCDCDHAVLSLTDAKVPALSDAHGRSPKNADLPRWVSGCPFVQQRQGFVLRAAVDDHNFVRWQGQVVNRLEQRWQAIGFV
jgi:hypothetical protein